MGQPVPAEDLPSGAVPASDMPQAMPAASAAPTPAPASRSPGILGQAMETAQYAIPVVGPTRALGKATDVLDKYAYKAGQAVTDIAAPHMPAPLAAGLGTAANVGLQTIPMALGGEAGKLAAPAMQSTARKLMTSALKPDKFARESGNAAKAVETLLQKGYNVTAGGVEKMTAEIDKLDEALTKAIANAKGNVTTISIMKPIKDALNKFKDGLDHAESSEAIKKELLKFFDHPEVQGAFQIPVQTAQRIKQAIYGELGDKAYGLGLKPKAQLEGKKAVARGLKEGLERASPEAAMANKEMGPLINARDIAQDRVLASGNKNPLGLGFINPKMLPAWLADRSELMKSLGARALYSGSEAVPTTAGRALGAVQGADEGRRPKEKSR